MTKEQALKIILDLIVSLKPNLRATEQAHAQINEAIKILSEVEKPIDQPEPQS